MRDGTIAWFNPGTGFGCVAPADGAASLFLFIGTVERCGIDPAQLLPGAAIEFTTTDTDGRPVIDQLRLRPT